MHPEGLLCCTFADGEQYAWNKVRSWKASRVCTYRSLLVRLLQRCLPEMLSEAGPARLRQVVTSINNLILGKIYIDHGGIMKASGCCKLI